MQHDDLTIVAWCQAGQLDQFALLFDRYSKKIYNFIYFRTHHQETAEDLTSVTFMKALEHIDSFKPQHGSFQAWLYRIAKNTVIDHYRTAKPAVDIEDAWDVPANVNIERDVDLRAKMDEVKAYLQQLPAQQRDIVVMRVWDGLSHKEIAEILGISEASSKMNFSRALAKINSNVALTLALLALTV